MAGVLRARFRDAEDKQHHVFGSNYEHETLSSGDPKDVVRYDISLRSIANRFEKASHSRRDHERPRRSLVIVLPVMPRAQPAIAGGGAP
jgi:hypothetical protein